jgi:hypothetical protein
MSRHSIRAFPIAVAALVAMLIFPAGAPAEQPQFFTNEWDFNETFEDFCGVAGLTVEANFTGHENVQIRSNPNKGEFPFFSVHVQFFDTWTGPNGKVVTVEANFRLRDIEIIDNGDGTITIHQKVTGAPNTITGPDGERSIDRGLAIFAFTVDYNGTPSDPDDDVFVSDDGIVRMAGPHPDLEDGGAFCPIAVPAFTS